MAPVGVKGLNVQSILFILYWRHGVRGTDSTNQTVIINESVSSDGSVVPHLPQQAPVQLAAASVPLQPVITSTSSAPDVLYTTGVTGYHDDSGPAAAHSAKSSFVHFEEHGSDLVPAYWTNTPNRPDVVLPAQVPAYRPAPDYDTVMQQRLLSQYYPSYISPYLSPDCTSFSQPDIYQHSVMGGHWNVAGTRVPAFAVHGGLAVDRANSLVIDPEPVGVERHASVASSIVPRTNQYLYYRVPPPYPRQSSSTPDLASPTKLGTFLAHGGLDLRQRQLIHNAVAQSQFDESLKNLAAETQQLHIYGSQTIDPGYSLPTADNTAVRLEPSGITLHPCNVSVASHYGHPTPNAGVRYIHTNGDANQFDYMQFDKYVHICLVVFDVLIYYHLSALLKHSESLMGIVMTVLVCLSVCPLRCGVISAKTDQRSCSFHQTLVQGL